jgi:hypothetical protein
MLVTLSTQATTRRLANCGRRTFSTTRARLQLPYLKSSCSRVKYDQIAPIVNMPVGSDKYENIPLFEIRRSRIPTTVVKQIVEDMDILLIQYGTLERDGINSEQAWSRFFAPVSFLIYLLPD